MSFAQRILEKYGSTLNEANKSDFKAYCQDILKEVQNLHIFVLDPEEKPKYMIGSTQTCSFSVFQVFKNKDNELSQKEAKSASLDLFNLLNLKDMNLTSNRDRYALPLVCTGMKDNYSFKLKFDYDTQLDKENRIYLFTVWVNFTITAKELSSPDSFSEFPDIIPGTIYNAGLSGFYQVVRRSGNTIYLQSINSKDSHTPIPNDFTNDTIIRKVIRFPNEIELGRNRTAYHWDIANQTYYR